MKATLETTKKTRGKFKYNISIVFDGLKKSSYKEYKSNYTGGLSREDKIKISKEEIVLECIRNSRIEIDDVLKNYHSSLFLQISKAISFYSCYFENLPELHHLNICCSKNEKEIYNKKYNASELLKTTCFTNGFENNFYKNSIEILFLENQKSSNLLKAISHLINSKTKKDEFERFDGLWKAFNGIYKEIAKKSKDHECHVELRNKLLADPQFSKSTTNLIKSLDSSCLRNKLRWRSLILNDYPKEKDTKSFKDFVFRYSDHRIMNILKETLPYRSDFLRAAGFYNEVETHIDENIAKKNINDLELTSILCIKYMYFVRNKSAHGERLERIFNIKDGKEVQEMIFLNKILESFVIDLFNANNKY